MLSTRDNRVDGESTILVVFWDNELDIVAKKRVTAVRD